MAGRSVAPFSAVAILFGATVLQAENSAAMGAALAPGVDALATGCVLVLLTIATAIALAFRAYRSKIGLAVALTLDVLVLAWTASHWRTLDKGLWHAPLWSLLLGLTFSAFVALAPIAQYRTFAARDRNER
jgi:hypothetical protein